VVGALTSQKSVSLGFLHENENVPLFLLSAICFTVHRTVLLYGMQKYRHHQERFILHLTGTQQRPN